MDSMFHCGRAFSAHIEQRKSKCDYHFTAESVPTDEQLKAVEAKVNEVIQMKLPVTTEIVKREDAASLFDLSRLPEEAGDYLRLVHVGDYDVCPCIGEHAQNTSEIKSFRIISSSYDDGVFRLRWKAELAE
jgi:alanyl-tRNA synthetase